MCLLYVCSEVVYSVNMKFIVLYLAPAAVLAAWVQKPEAERAEEDQKMRADWDTWMAAHQDIIIETNAAGKTKRLSKTGATDVTNDIMLYSIVTGASAEAVAEIFKDHPHFGIPDGTIEIMPIRAM